MRLSVRVRGGCWPRRCAPWSRPTAPSSAISRDENGYRLVVRNGYHGAHEVTTAVGAVKVRAPRVNDRRVDPESGERQRVSSAILLPWARKTPQVEQVLPLPRCGGRTDCWRADHQSR